MKPFDLFVRNGLAPVGIFAVLAEMTDEHLATDVKAMEGYKE